MGYLLLKIDHLQFYQWGDRGGEATTARARLGAKWVPLPRLALAVGRGARRRAPTAHACAPARHSQPGRGACHLSVFTKIKWSYSIRGCHYCLRHAISTINNLLYLLHRQKGEEARQIFDGRERKTSPRAAGQSRAGRFARDPVGTAAAPDFAGGRWSGGRLRLWVPVPLPVPGRAEPPPGRLDWAPAPAARVQKVTGVTLPGALINKQWLLLSWLHS